MRVKVVIQQNIVNMLGGRTDKLELHMIDKNSKGAKIYFLRRTQIDKKYSIIV